MANRYYAAYGSNLNIRHMKFRCPDAKIIGTTQIDGYELLFKGSRTGSYLTIEPNVKNHVPAAVWKVSKRDERSLDRYEGYPIFYDKKEMTADVMDLKTGKTSRQTIFLYIMDESRATGLPTRDYVETCLEGYEAFGFDENYIFEALERSGNEIKCTEKNLPDLP